MKDSLMYEFSFWVETFGQLVTHKQFTYMYHKQVYVQTVYTHTHTHAPLHVPSSD